MGDERGDEGGRILVVELGATQLGPFDNGGKKMYTCNSNRLVVRVGQYRSARRNDGMEEKLSIKGV